MNDRHANRFRHSSAHAVRLRSITESKYADAKLGLRWHCLVNRAMVVVAQASSTTLLTRWGIVVTQCSGHEPDEAVILRV